MLHDYSSDPFLFLKVPRFEVVPSPGIAEWLATTGVSLLFTTTNSQLFTVGLKPNGQLEVGTHEFERCTALAVTKARTLYMVTRYQLWRLENAIPVHATTAYDHDVCYIPKSAYTIGALHVNDLTIDHAEQPIFINTLYNCLATTSEQYNFATRWRPPHLRHLPLTIGDRCHLTGVALQDGQAAFVTSASLSDQPEGWQDQRRQGGVIFDLSSDQVIAHGLSMPCAPRWHQNQLWLLNSGTGHLGYLNIHRGDFEAVTFCPGVLHGLTFINDYAITTLSKPDPSGPFTDLVLNEQLAHSKTPAQCALLIVDLRTGQIAHSLQFIGKTLSGICDVALLPAVRRPSLITFDDEAIEDAITVANPVALGIKPWGLTRPNLHQ